MPLVRVAISLAGNEFAPTLRHPLLVAGAVGSGMAAFGLLRPGAPVWPEESVLMGGALLPLVMVSFLVASWIAMRDRRLAIREWLDSLGRDPRAEILGHLSLTVAPMAWALLVYAGSLTYIAIGQPTGDIAWLELIGGLTAVALGWVLGVACGYVTTAGIVPVLIVIGMAFVQLIASPDVALSTFDNPALEMSRLAPWNPPSAFDTPEDLALRPSAVHLGFLVAGVGAAVLSALGSRSERHDRYRYLATAAWGVVAFVAVILVRMPEQRADWTVQVRDQTCRSIGGVEYCAFGTYQSWIPHWAATVAGPTELVPMRLARVVQRPTTVRIGDDPSRTDDGVAFTTTEWDRPGTKNPTWQVLLATQSVFPSIGLPTSGDSVACTAVGQGRAAVALWAAAAGVEHGDNVLRSSINAGRGNLLLGDLPTIGNSVLGVEDARLALELVDLPTEQVSQTLEQHWASLAEPEITTGDVAAWFDLEFEPQMENDEAIMLSPCP